MTKEKIDTLILSDIHFGSELCNAELLFEVMSKFKFRRLILNGDIFDHLNLEFEEKTRHLRDGEPPRVLEGRHGIVDRAGADDDEQAVVGTLEDAANALARGGDQRLHGRVLDRKEADQVFRRWQQHHVDDVLVVGARGAVVAANFVAVSDGFGGHGTDYRPARRKSCSPG